MERDIEKTVVVFRKFLDGDVIAIFPEMQANEKPCDCGSYMHIGQHGAVSYLFTRASKPASPEEYADLKVELESIGYNLDIKKKITKRWYERGRK